MYLASCMIRDCKFRYDNLQKVLNKEIGKSAAHFDTIEAKRESDEEGIMAVLPKINSIFLDLSCAISELQYFDLRGGFRTIFKITGDSIVNFLKDLNKEDSTTTVSEIKKTCDNIFSMLSDFNVLSVNASRECQPLYYSKYHDLRLVIDTQMATAVFEKFKNVHRGINVLVPYCSKRISSEHLDVSTIMKTVSSDFSIHANPLNTTITNYIDRNSIARTAIGESSSMTNNAFDVLFLSPNITNNVSEETFGMIPRSERNMLRSFTGYLRPDGWLIMTIPFYRLSGVAEYIAKNFTDVKVFASMNNDENAFADHGEIYLVAKKKFALSRDFDVKTYNYLRSFYYKDSLTIEKNDITSDDFNNFTISLPKKEAEIKTFRTAILDERQIEKIAASMDTLSNFFDKQSSSIKDSFTNRKPLLPFNIGQIGLVLTSGCLDGVIDEDNGLLCHAIKGRIIKSKHDSTSIDNEGIETNVTIESNHVEIRVLLPNGQVKVLA